MISRHSIINFTTSIGVINDVDIIVNVVRNYCFSLFELWLEFAAHSSFVTYIKIQI